MIDRVGMMRSLSFPPWWNTGQHPSRFLIVAFCLDLKRQSLRSESSTRNTFVLCYNCVYTFCNDFCAPEDFTQWSKKIQNGWGLQFFGKVEQFLKSRQERSIDLPQTSGRLTAGDNVIEFHNQKSDSLKAIHAQTPSGKHFLCPTLKTLV